MEKQKPWQLYIIIAVLVLTLYNILPTIFYYSKPLKEAIKEPQAEQISQSIVNRVNSLEQDAKAWIISFSKLLRVHAESIEVK